MVQILLEYAENNITMKNGQPLARKDGLFNG